MDDKNAWKQKFELKKHSKTIKKHARKIENATTRHAHRFLVSRWDKIREIRIHIIVWLACVGLLIATVGIQMIWFQQTYITKAPISGGTYAEAVKGPVDTLNPLYASTPAELDASHLLFSSLYSNDTSGHLRGDIATTMTNVGDKVFTVNIRHDAHWQDGKPLTAADIAYTVGLMQSLRARSVMTASWQGIIAQQLDDYSIRFTLPAAYAAFPQALTFGILPMHLLKEVDPSALRESTYSTSPIGSGPFSMRLLQVVSQANGQKIIHLDANPNYYDGRARLDHLQLHAYNDDDSMAAAIKTGDVTGASNVASDLASGLDSKRYDTVIRPVNNGVYAILNTASAVLKDSTVRRALQMATDTNAIRQQIYGHPKQLYLPFIPYQVAGADTIPAPKYSASRAAQMLESAGWVMHDGVRTKGADKLHLRVVTLKSSDYETALEALSSQWRKLGVQIDSQIYDKNDPSQNFTTDVLQQRDYDVLLDELVIGGDPDVFAYWHSKGLLNFSNYGNQTSDDDLASARTKSESALRSLKYVDFAKQWLADVPAIGLYQTNFIYVHSTDTEAVQPSETIVSADDHYANVRYWTADQGARYKTP